MIWITVCLYLLLTPVPEKAGRLHVEVENIEQSRGSIWLGVYDSKGGFLHKEKAIIRQHKVSHTGRALVTFEGLPYGTYAVAIFHDLNGNDVLDLNWLGAPAEPFAFSAAVASNWRLPRFTEVAFPFNHNGQKLRMSLSQWKAW